MKKLRLKKVKSSVLNPIDLYSSYLLHFLSPYLPFYFLSTSSGFPGGPSGKEPTCQCRRQIDVSSIPGLGRSPEGGHGNPLQYSCLENAIDREVCWVTIHRTAKSQTWLKRLSRHTCMQKIAICRTLLSQKPTWDMTEVWINVYRNVFYLVNICILV